MRPFKVVQSSGGTIYPLAKKRHVGLAALSTGENFCRFGPYNYAEGPNYPCCVSHTVKMSQNGPLFRSEKYFKLARLDRTEGSAAR